MTDPAGSFIVRTLLALVGANHPIRVGVAFGAGILTSIGANILSVSFPDSAAFLYLAHLNIMYFVAIWIAALFAPIVFGRHGAPESSVHQINTVHAIMERAEMSQANKLMFWRSFLEKYIIATRPDLSRKPDVEKLAEETKQEINTDDPLAGR